MILERWWVFFVKRHPLYLLTLLDIIIHDSNFQMCRDAKNMGGESFKEAPISDTASDQTEVTNAR
ncbi:MAG: hypothetical protein A2X70_04835 [Alphaproteobacteria bacterium GWC2_42_16]|nr:MAG: hypothetical protein A2X70_04835 [Alphaproteobacteria bacterium GWC2_42_16]OFW73238.1 MAG: hypothetical protein A2Z80_07295 [Alphaproteobacteria bacterium GWA2_41_27]OFW81766.1 MAG: hypothetical protein A3E50_04700 [Alphaproteobacteria bacterium RIFCSPHIGHO2_12_FULL_42_100]OFW85586.1 MAG: hypothetical protein A2W06_05950 [Alphaproteobacteria bacterium RBG_16_42_14]OFW90771.1 MAG: hypothetical protein A3C41_00490 [Alphaproteobacteria bacterium RIFCSPHIGHO2_02_FULL_42_30]OFW92842.1 MAG: 